MSKISVLSLVRVDKQPISFDVRCEKRYSFEVWPGNKLRPIFPHKVTVIITSVASNNKGVALPV